MELKGKVQSVRKGWGGMYPHMESDATSKPEVSIQLDGGGHLSFSLPLKDAREYRVGDQVTVTVTTSKAPADE